MRTGCITRWPVPPTAWNMSSASSSSKAMAAPISKPIAHLYKSQVYQLAHYLEVPALIRQRTPTTGTFSLDQGQEEFFFSLPYAKMDLCLYARNHGIPAETVAPAVGLAADQVRRVFADIDAKRSAARYLHLPPILTEDVTGEATHLERKTSIGE